MRMRSTRVVLLAITLVLTLTEAVFGQAKVSGELKCSKVEPQYTLPVPDRSGHTFNIGKITCTAVKPFVIEGLTAVSEDVTIFREETGTRFRAQGRNVGSMSNGDKYFVSTQVSGAWAAGGNFTSLVKWTYSGGTGTLKGLTGKGTSKCSGAADGGSVCVVDGEYQIKK